MKIGRFAPTPSGPLHFGSLVTAVASYCDAKSNNGQWLLRIEDLDTPRVVPGSPDNILSTLEAFGFEWDGEVLYQSQRFKYYEQIIQELILQQKIYSCDCSRKSLKLNDLPYGPLGYIYPGHCRHRELPYETFSLRLNVQQTGTIAFKDLHYGTYKLNISKNVGDIVLKRTDGIYAYHLAVVLDDALQQVNSIVRGADLLEATTLHLHLNQILGLNNAEYLHVPLITTETGEKLSKQTGASAIDVSHSRKLLLSALKFLGQTVQSEMIEMKPREILKFASQQWDINRIPTKEIL